jgi:hypothetical protein
MPTASTPSDIPILTLRGPGDLASLGPFLKERRRAAGFRSAKEAAPHLGVTPRLLVEVERGERTKRGITLGKLLSVLAQLGYELELRPRRSVVHANLELRPPPPEVRGEGTVTQPSADSRKSKRRPARS